MLVRGKAEYLGGTKVRFTCPHGHSHIKDLGKGKISKRLSENATKLMVQWWSKNGVTFQCNKC